MSELTRFQDAFTEALTGDFAPLAPFARGADAETRFSVYRNTVAKGCADALAAQFPTVLRVVGEAWMAKAGVLFARAHPPSQPSLLAYGIEFPAWLEAFEPAADMPYLSGLARIDWAVRDALFAPDAPPLSPDVLAALGPEGFARLSGLPHPAAQALWFADGTPGLWRALQAETPEAELAPEPQGLLVTRPGLEVRTLVLQPGAHAFLMACAAGLSLAAAAERALSQQPDLPLRETFAELITAGAFARLVPASPEPNP